MICLGILFLFCVVEASYFKNTCRAHRLPFVPGLFEGVPGADRARSGQQPAAGPAVPAGERHHRWQQGEGAAGPVQHPHGCTRRRLMNSHASLAPVRPLN